MSVLAINVKHFEKTEGERDVFCCATSAVRRVPGFLFPVPESSPAMLCIGGLAAAV
jgi:hypothetical protein